MGTKKVKIRKNGMVANSDARFTRKKSADDRVKWESSNKSGPWIVQFGFTGSPFSKTSFKVPKDGGSVESGPIGNGPSGETKYTYCVKDDYGNLVDDPDIIIER